MCLMALLFFKNAFNNKTEAHQERTFSNSLLALLSSVYVAHFQKLFSWKNYNPRLADTETRLLETKNRENRENLVGGSSSRVFLLVCFASVLFSCLELFLLFRAKSR